MATREFWSSNETKYRLGRTILQGIIGVIIANADLIVGSFNIPPAYKPMIVALVMAVLSPIMSEFGAAGKDTDELTEEEAYEWMDDEAVEEYEEEDEEESEEEDE